VRVCIALLLLAASLNIGGTGLQAQRPFPVQRLPSGIFGDTRFSRESGDIGGMELRVRQEDGHDIIEFYIAEGACDAMQRSILLTDGAGWKFTYSDDGTVKHRINLWLSVGRRGVRIQADEQGRWLVPAAQGSLLHPIANPLCFRPRRHK
jgi:hypothetical protein